MKGDAARADGDAALAELRKRIEATLSERSGARATVRALAPLTGGACQDNFRLDVVLEGDAAAELAGERRLVLRSDAPGSLPGSFLSGRLDPLA